MFKLVQSQSYFWPVTVEVPTDGGKYEKHTFDGEFKRLPQDRLKEIYDQMEKGLTDVELCKEVLVGWKGVVDEGGDLPFSETAREKLLNVSLVSASIVRAFFDSITGSKRKN